MKPKCELFKWLFLGAVALTMMAIVLPGCAQGETVPVEEGETEEAPAATSQIAEADGLRIELGDLLITAVDIGVEVADYCDTFWKTWRDGTREEMLQLAEEYPGMVTKVAEAKAELNYVPTIIDKVEELDIPSWYQEYFDKKEQVADYLATAFHQAEEFLSGVEPMVDNMEDYITVGEGILNFWEEIIPEIGSLIDEENYSQARQRVTTAAGSVDDMENLLIEAYDQAGVPVLTWLSDRCGSLEEVLVLVTDWLGAKETGNTAQIEQLQNVILDFIQEELEILESIPWDESNIWFETNFGSYIDQGRDSLSQVVSVNTEAELAYEAHWTPLEDAPMFDVGKTDATDNVHKQVYKESEGSYYWESGDIVEGHPEIDIVGTHTRQEEDNIIFWMEVEGPITDDYNVTYSFDVRTTLHGGHLLVVEYSNGEAECYLRETGDSIACEYQKSDTALMILLPSDIVGSSAGWIVNAGADDWRELEWDETYTKVLSGEWYRNDLQLTDEE